MVAQSLVTVGGFPNVPPFCTRGASWGSSPFLRLQEQQSGRCRIYPSAST